jgi:hypothetical protein
VPPPCSMAIAAYGENQRPVDATNQQQAAA